MNTTGVESKQMLPVLFSYICQRRRRVGGRIIDILDIEKSIKISIGFFVLLTKEARISMYLLIISLEARKSSAFILQYILKKISKITLNLSKVNRLSKWFAIRQLIVFLPVRKYICRLKKNNTAMGEYRIIFW